MGPKKQIKSSKKQIEKKCTCGFVARMEIIESLVGVNVKNYLKTTKQCTCNISPISSVSSDSSVSSKILFKTFKLGNENEDIPKEKTYAEYTEIVKSTSKVLFSTRKFDPVVIWAYGSDDDHRIKRITTSKKEEKVEEKKVEEVKEKKVEEVKEVKMIEEEQKVQKVEIHDPYKFLRYSGRYKQEEEEELENFNLDSFFD